MNIIEQEIVNKLSGLNHDQQQKVLEFIDTLREPRQHYTARDLMKLPAEERDRLVAQAFELAANEDFEVFETYSEENFGRDTIANLG